MQLCKFIVLAKMFSNLGDAVGDQLMEVLMGEDLSTKNPNALKLMVPFLKKAELAGVIDAEYERENIEDYLKQQGVL